MKPWLTVGSVPYVNARPLVHQLERSPGVRVLLDLPSNLPSRLDSGAADVVLVSSFEALAGSGRRVAEGCSISSFGPAESVRLFSKRPLGEIESLALDASSLTSNNLALALLAESYGCRPRAETCPPDLAPMLATHDAALLIGDRGMRASGEGLRVLDLGEAWTALTHKPFVWALWVGGESLSPEACDALLQARVWGQEHLDEIVRDAAMRAGWPLELARHYLVETMSYDLTEAHLEGLRLFGELLHRHGLLAVEPALPPIVNSRERTIA